MFVFKRKENSIKVKPEVLEDLWHLIKIIKPKDFVTAHTHRKFTAASGDVERKPVTIKLEVEKTEFHKGFEKLRILGVIVEGKPEEYVQLREHHSFDVGPGDEITLEKNKWAKYELDRLKEAQKSAKRPKVAVLTLDEREAELFSIREFGIEEKGKVFAFAGGKYTEERKDLRNKYLSEIHDLVKNIDAEKIIVAGTGFEPENFVKFVKEKDQKLYLKLILQKTGWTGKSAVLELVKNGAIDNVAKESRFSEETKLIEELIRELPSSRPKAKYGYANVKKALEYGAVQTLLVLDSKLFTERDKIEPILDEAEKYNTKIMLISSENEASSKLGGLGGIAALLRFPIG